MNHEQEQEYYRNPPINVSGIIVRNKKILIGKRNIEPKKGYWTLIGGFVEEQESLEEALKREIAEEIHCASSSFSYLCSMPTRYEKRKIIVVYFICEIKGEPKASGEISGLLWTKHAPKQMAFVADQKALRIYRGLNQ